MNETCVQCGTPLQPHVGRGRPSRYCDTFCRRLAEFQLRRLMRRLSLADSDVDEYDRRARGLGYYGGSSEKAAEGLEAALERKAALELELAALIAHQEGKPT